MSKSAATDSGIVYLLDDNATIERKFKRAVTDSDGVVAYDRENKPGVSNLLDILSAATGTPVETLANNYTQYGPLKKDAGDAVIALIDPIRAKYHELMGDPAELSRLLMIGNDRARNVAAATLSRAHTAIGLLPRI
jgi:tryptophanyl-tRNA synthetase